DDPRIKGVEQRQREEGAQVEPLVRAGPGVLGNTLDLVNGSDELDATCCALVAEPECLVEAASHVHHAPEPPLRVDEYALGAGRERDQGCVPLVVVTLDEAVDDAEVRGNLVCTPAFGE